MQLSIRVDSSALQAGLKDAVKQMPFALSVLNNQLAEGARLLLRQRTGNYLTLRNTFTLSGLRVNRGNKIDTSAAVGFEERRWWMASQVAGESGRTNPGGKPDWQALSTGTRPPRTAKTRPIPAGRRPNVAGATGRGVKGRKVNPQGYFAIRSNVSWPGIFYREKGEGRKFVAAYWLQSTTNIKKRLPMLEIVSDSVAAHLPAATDKALRLALKPKAVRP